MIFSKKTIRITSIPKIRKIHSGVWKLTAKNLQNCQFWPKNGQILAISEFSRHIHYDFLKEDHKGSFHTKNYEIAEFERHMPKLLPAAGKSRSNLHYRPFYSNSCSYMYLIQQKISNT